MKRPASVSSRSNQRHSRARRRLLQSVAASGAAVTVKALPDKWAKPILETTMLPAHAQATNCQLSCEVTAITGGARITPSPPIPGGNDVQVDRWANQGTNNECGATANFESFFDDVNVAVAALVDPICQTVDLTASLSGETSVYVLTSGGDQAGVVNPGNGSVSFTPVNVSFDPTGFTVNANPSTMSAELDLRINAGGNECNINVIFSEIVYCIPPG